jgi:hypothetical protein
MRFKDFASNQNSPMRVHHVTAIQFRQVLAKVELDCTEPEFRALMRKYAAHSDGFVCYKLFCDELQPPPPHINPWKTVTQS